MLQRKAIHPPFRPYIPDVIINLEEKPIDRANAAARRTYATQFYGKSAISPNNRAIVKTIFVVRLFVCGSASAATCPRHLSERFRTAVA